MEFVDNRTKSFKASRNKKGWPRKISELGKYFEPKYLAQLGFYHTPQKDKVDLVTCVNCTKVCDWSSENQHPIQYHLQNDPCKFIRIWGGVECDRTSDDWKDLCNHSENLENMKEILLSSFQGLVEWPFNAKQAQTHPSAEEVAAAGFCFLPSSESKDLTICPYCEVTLDGWEESDDPM